MKSQTFAQALLASRPQSTTPRLPLVSLRDLDVPHRRDGTLRYDLVPDRDFARLVEVVYARGELVFQAAPSVMLRFQRWGAHTRPSLRAEPLPSYYGEQHLPDGSVVQYERRQMRLTYVDPPAPLPWPKRVWRAVLELFNKVVDSLQRLG